MNENEKADLIAEARRHGWWWDVASRYISDDAIAEFRDEDRPNIRATDRIPELPDNLIEFPEAETLVMVAAWARNKIQIQRACFDRSTEIFFRFLEKHPKQL